MKPYSEDLRWKLVEAYERGEGSLREMATRFAVSLHFVWSLWNRYQQTGSVDPKPHGGGARAKLDEAALAHVRLLVQSHPDATVLELRDRFMEQTGLDVSRATMTRALQQLGFTRKKKSLYASEREQKPEVEKARAAFREAEPNKPADRLVFIDESSTYLGMTKTHARAPVGQRVYGSQPAHPENISLIAALRLEGIVAALLVPGSVNGVIFKHFVESLLVPVLNPGDQVLMDNVRFHKVEGIAQAIEGAGATVEFLPPYSPDFSPIENGFSKIKETLRTFGSKTLETFVDSVKHALKAISENDAKGWFQHCGYRIPSI